MKKKTSLTLKLTITMILLVCGMVGFVWLMNVLFLEDFYIREKKEELFAGFHTIETAYEEGKIGEEEFDVTFERLCVNSNVSILVIDAESKVVRSSTQDVQSLAMQLEKMIQEQNGQKEQDERNVQWRHSSGIPGRLLSKGGGIPA